MNGRRSIFQGLTIAGLLHAFCMTPLASATITGHAAVPSPLDSLRSQIAHLRTAARYGEAVPLARQLLDMQSQSPATRAWQITDTRRLIKTLETVSAMPAPARGGVALADCLDDGIERHYEHGDYDVASEVAKRQAALRRAYLGGHHPDLVNSLVALAFTQWKLGDHSAAAKTAREGMEIAEKIDADHPRTGECLNVLGLANMASGNLDEAGECYRRALEIFRQQTGEESLTFTMVLENLGALHGERSEWALAEPYYKTCLSVNRRLLGPDHPEVARSLHNLGSCYLAQRDVLRAQPLLEEALEIRREVLGDEHPDVALTTHLLSDVYRIKGDFDRAHDLLEKALAIRTARLQQDHPQIAWNLFALSTLDLARGDYKAAYERGERALAIWAASDEEMQYARGLWHMGTLEWRRGDLAAVESYDRQVREILADCDCGDYSRVLTRSAATLAHAGRHAEAESLLVVASGVFENHRRTSTTVGQRGWEWVANPYRLLAAERLCLGKTAEAWPTLERWLARGLIDQLTGREGEKGGRIYELGQIQAALGEDEAIVGWLDIEGIPGPAAWGYVIRCRGPVQWVELAEAMTHHARSLRDGLRFTAAWPSRVTRTDRIDSSARGLWHERMEPLEPYLRDVSRLIVVPSRVMMGVPVETMIDPSGQHLLDRYSVSYVPSASVYRWLTERRSSRRRHNIGKALLVGDPALAPRTAAESHVSKPEVSVHRADLDRRADSTFEITVLRAALAGNPDALRLLPPLTESEKEVRAIAGLVGDATVLVEEAASEKNIHSLVEDGRLASFDLIHFATHAIVDEHVPEVSALILSQRNRTDDAQPIGGDENDTDGLLNVGEIISEWQLDANLVTLSGCRTALGPARQGEGYLGFARAFLRAGAQAVLVSLWDVDDTATSMLMTRFYENLTGHYEAARRGHGAEPMSTAEALCEAKQWLRDYGPGDGSHPFSHPSYWSAFILIGDPF